MEGHTSTLGSPNTDTPTPNTNMGTPETIEIQDEPVTVVLGKKRRFISAAWDHFTHEVRDGKDKAICNYCAGALVAGKKDGTRHLNDHVRSCVMRKYRNISSDFSQKRLKIENSGDQKGKIKYGSGAYSEDEARRALSNMVIMHEYPLSIVEHLGFRRYSKTLNYNFKMISRNTLKSDILKNFEFEKLKTMKLVRSAKGRVAITTDMWTAQNQRRGFIAITGHWVDNTWALQSRILRFAYVPCPHTAEVICEELFICFSEWNLTKKLSSLTVDNCSSNDATIAILLDRLDTRALPLKGKYFHMRCCAHILNLIVKDGLQVIETSIEKIRNSVFYWRASGKRGETFIDACESLSIPYSKKLKLDCSTRWNSNFLMIQTALLYKDVFSKLAKRDKHFKCLPDDDEWDKARDICDKLEVFYDVTQIFSGTKYPTANVYFPKIFDVRMALEDWSYDTNPIIKNMSRKMLDKWEKYWECIHGIMGVACVMDPRYKLEMLECCYSTICDFDISEKIELIKDTCYTLFREYKERFEVENDGTQHVSSDSTHSSTLNSGIRGYIGKRRTVSHIFKTTYKKDQPTQKKSEMDLYLEERCVPDSDTFDILEYWKGCESKQPILSRIARDIYAIPVSTVASESAFSTGGRFVTPHRNRLHPKTLEALMCARDWLWASVVLEDDEEATTYHHSSYEDDPNGEIEEE